MNDPAAVLLPGGLLAAACGAPAAAADGVPRTPEGLPDFNGVWQVMTTASWNLLDHNAQKGRAGRAGNRGEEREEFRQAMLEHRGPETGAYDLEWLEHSTTERRADYPYPDGYFGVVDPPTARVPWQD